MRFTEISGRVETFPGLTDENICAIESALKLPIPSEYKRLLRSSDGVRVDGGQLLYGAADLEERNGAYQVQRFVPEFLAIGDNGGGRLVLLRADENDPRVFACDAGALAEDMLHPVSASLVMWLENGCPIDTPTEPEAWSYDMSVDIMLARVPSMAQLMRLRSVTGSAVPIMELKRALAALPIVLRGNVPYGKYLVKISRDLGPLTEFLEVVGTEDASLRLPVSE